MRRIHALALWVASAVWLFWGPLFAGRVLYFRDVTYTYFPDFVFCAQSLSEGLWPLWHPGADAGAPHLATYPVHLLLLLLCGPRLTLALSPPLHVLIAMIGMGGLHRTLGGRWPGAAVAGAVVGLSGLMLGSVLFPVFLSASWAPLAIALAVRVVQSPSWRRAAALALVLALEVSALGIEALPQTVLAVAILTPAVPSRRSWAALSGAMVCAALLAAPTLLGALWLLRDTARGAGFTPEVALSYSASLPVLLEGVLPRFLGDPHTFSDLSFWGQPFFPDGSPLFLSLYVGPVVLLLAGRAGGRQLRLWGMVVVGVLLALGANGPLGTMLAQLARVLPVRAPVKFCFLSLLGLALLAGRGLDNGLGQGSRPAKVLALPLFVLSLAFLAWWLPESVSLWLSSFVPAASGSLARHVIATRWPVELALTGATALGAALALMRGGRVVVLAGLLAVLDLFRVNGDLNPSATTSFYSLRPSVQQAVASTRASGRYRWFSYGGGSGSSLIWHPEITRANSDVWLYYLDRQALAPRTQVLDGLEGAYDIDRMGLAPEGSTLPPWELRPDLFGRHYQRLRHANVRWVLSFVALPKDLAKIRREIRFPEVTQPLLLYELYDALPRAYYSRTLEGPPESEGAVEYHARDPHTVEIRAETPPGFVIVLDGYHPDWRADEGGSSVPIRRVFERYRAIPTPGGDRVFIMRFQPRWRAPALLAMGVGLLVVVVMGIRGEA